MAQEIEIEFKNLLTKQEFHLLLDKLPFSKSSIEQTNHYFETNPFTLKKHGSALRIRYKNGKYRLTLKEPHELGLQETHDTLTEQEAKQWLNGNIIPKEHTTKQLKQMGVNPEELTYFGSLTTRRHEINYRGSIIVLDLSTYNGKEDYEFELETNNREKGLALFQELMSTYGIPIRKTPNKIERFFLSLPK